MVDSSCVDCFGARVILFLCSSTVVNNTVEMLEMFIKGWPNLFLFSLFGKVKTSFPTLIHVTRRLLNQFYIW